MSNPLKILVANGVNLDLLGTRETAIYGSETLADINKVLKSKAPALAKSLGVAEPDLTFFQTNVESELFAKLDEAWDGVLLNPAAWTHTSVALADRLKALSTTYVEVHISNVSNREPFRKVSYTAPHAAGVVYGFGSQSYLTGLHGLLSKLASV